MGEAELVVDVAQQLYPGERVALVDLLADLAEVRAAVDQVGGGLQGVRRRGRILEAAGVGADGGEEAIGDRLGDLPTGPFAEVVDQLAARRFAGRDPVDVGVLRVRRVVVDVDERAALPDVLADTAEPLEARAIGGDDDIEGLPGLGLLHPLLGVEET